MTSILSPFLLLLAATPDAGAVTEGHSDHAAMVDARGDQAMGFPHDATVHHFVLTADGGFISADALSPADSSTRKSIRQHMGHIAAAFAQGDFDLPMFIHDTAPPGVETMKRLRAQIQYAEQSTNLGARLTIRTTNGEALEAIHAFLRFQIAEHRTKDSTEVAR